MVIQERRTIALLHSLLRRHCQEGRTNRKKRSYLLDRLDIKDLVRYLIEENNELRQTLTKLLIGAPTAYFRAI
jgi:hypothetical protein